MTHKELVKRICFWYKNRHQSLQLFWRWLHFLLWGVGRVCMANYGTCKCVECGCTGNETCGAKAVKGDCCLDQSLICPCCNNLGKKENMKRWKRSES